MKIEDMSYREMVVNLLGGGCVVCGRSKPVFNIYVHHIDGDHKNNEASNLTLLCSRCHVRHHRSGGPQGPSPFKPKKPKRKYALEVLGVLMNRSTMTPRRISIELDAQSQKVREALVILNGLQFVEREMHGHYVITDMGYNLYKDITQSSKQEFQASEGDKQ